MKKNTWREIDSSDCRESLSPLSRLRPWLKRPLPRELEEFGDSPQIYASWRLLFLCTLIEIFGPNQLFEFDERRLKILLVIEKLVFATDWEACIFYKNYWEVWIGEFETTIDTLNWSLEKEKPIERLGKFGLINFPSNRQLSVWLVYDLSSPNYGVEVRWNGNYLLCIEFWCLFGSFYCEVW